MQRSQPSLSTCVLLGTLQAWCRMNANYKLQYDAVDALMFTAEGVTRPVDRVRLEFYHGSISQFELRHRHTIVNWSNCIPVSGPLLYLYWLYNGSACAGSWISLQLGLTFAEKCTGCCFTMNSRQHSKIVIVLHVKVSKLITDQLLQMPHTLSWVWNVSSFCHCNHEPIIL